MTTDTVLTEEQLVRQATAATAALIDKLVVPCRNKLDNISL